MGSTLQPACMVIPSPILSSQQPCQAQRECPRIWERASSSNEFHGQVQIWTWQSLVLVQCSGNYAMWTLPCIHNSILTNVPVLMQVPQGSLWRNNPSSPQRMPVLSGGRARAALVTPTLGTPLDLQAHVKVLIIISQIGCGESVPFVSEEKEKQFILNSIMIASGPLASGFHHT